VLITFSELAMIKGCTKAAVTHASKSRIAAAVVEKDGKRWLDRDQALELWDKNTKATSCSKVRQADPIEPADLKRRIDALPSAAIPDLNESRARHEHFKAELAALQLATQQAELVPAAEVKAAAFKLARTVRDGLMSIPDRLAAQLAGTTDARQCHTLLTEELRVALRGLADG
jgi:phage terminase Nu1 subunit (DNA packaging protein)